MDQEKIILLFDIDDTMFNTALLKETDLTRFEMYDDVYSGLEELSKVASLGIFSQGQVAFQLKKLNETNIKDYFIEEHVHIVEDKIASVKELLENYEGSGKIYLIEDRLDVLKFAKECSPEVVTVWMKRGRYAQAQRHPVKYTPDATVEDLHQVVSLIKSS